MREHSLRDGFTTEVHSGLKILTSGGLCGEIAVVKFIIEIRRTLSESASPNLCTLVAIGDT